MGFSISRQTISYCCLWHAADTPPLEGLPFLRCAIYDRVEGLQIWKMKFAKMGGWGGVITFLTSIIHGPRNLLPLYTKKGTLGLTAGHGVIMSPWFALLDSVAVALPKALWHWGFEKRKRHGWVDVCMGYVKIINFWCFFLSLEEQNRFTAQAKRTFWHLSHTPANRHDCPCCKHFLTSSTNTSILSLSLENVNFKFVTLLIQYIHYFAIRTQYYNYNTQNVTQHNWFLNIIPNHITTNFIPQIPMKPYVITMFPQFLHMKIAIFRCILHGWGRPAPPAPPMAPSRSPRKPCSDTTRGPRWWNAASTAWIIITWRPKPRRNRVENRWNICGKSDQNGGYMWENQAYEMEVYGKQSLN